MDLNDQTIFTNRRKKFFRRMRWYNLAYNIALPGLITSNRFMMRFGGSEEMFKAFCIIDEIRRLDMDDMRRAGICFGTPHEAFFKIGGLIVGIHQDYLSGTQCSLSFMYYREDLTYEKPVAAFKVKPTYWMTIMVGELYSKFLNSYDKFHSESLYSQFFYHQYLAHMDHSCLDLELTFDHDYVTMSDIDHSFIKLRLELL